MKKTLFSLMIFTQIFNAYAQTNSEIYEHQGYSIGTLQTGGANCPEAYMPEVILVGSTYYLYYSTKYGGTKDAISYATSTDLLNWTVQDTIMTGSLVSTDPDYILGGSRVIELAGGNYRMFYRTAESYITPAEPMYHIRSAISTDGINYVKEGIRIPIEYFTPGSYFTHVGHSEFYYDQGGNLAALLTGKDTTMTLSEPDRIYTAVSFDEGITWGNFVPLYESCHDPVVIIDSSYTYHVYFTYLNEGFRTAQSTNGVVWPAIADTLHLIQGTDTLTETGAPKIADLGASVAPDGTIYIYSNYQTTLGPWTNVAYYTFGGYVGTEIVNQPNIDIYPNPVNDLIYFNIDKTKIHSVQVYNTHGQIIYSEILFNDQPIVCSEWNSGLYFYKLVCEGETVGSGKLIKQ